LRLGDAHKVLIAVDHELANGLAGIQVVSQIRHAAWGEALLLPLLLQPALGGIAIAASAISYC
jgi:hypothetical protein